MPMSIRLPEQNQVFLVGRLTRDPEVRYTQKGQAVCSFDIAVNRRFKDNNSNEWRDDVTFVPIVVWGQIAENCKERLKKGSPVHVEGRLSISEYTDKSGQKRKNMQVISKRLQFLAYTPSTQRINEDADTTSSSSGIEREPVASEDSFDDVPF
jgi:single-strand DNA-binding protein